MTGTTTALGTSLNPPNPFSLRWADQGLLAFDRGNRVYFLPDLTFTDVPINFSLDYQMGPLEDDRWLVRAAPFGSSGPSFAILDLEDGSTSPLFYRSGQLLGPHRDGVLILDAPSCCIEGSFPSEGPLWYVPLDGSEAHKVADRATSFRHRPDPQRLVTAVDIEKDRRGVLALVDLETRAEQQIDDHVLFGPTAFATADDPTLITWAVHDGERSGVWSARLPPAP